MKLNNFRHLVIGSVMLVAAFLALVLTPREKFAEHGSKIDLETMIPKKFGDWQMDESIVPLQISPDVEARLNRIYNQTLSRTYTDKQGLQIMLSIAYGGDQSDAMQVHKPEVCYPAQGFVLDDKTAATLQIGNIAIPVSRVATHLGQRREPITYWTTVGDRTVKSGIHKKLVEMSYGLTGKIPDGMLVRVSSIDPETARAYAIHDRFIDQMLAAVSPEDRQRLAGAPGK